MGGFFFFCPYNAQMKALAAISACLFAAVQSLDAACPAPGGNVLMILDDPAALGTGDTAVRMRLQSTFGYTVAMVDDDAADEAASALGMDWVYISSTSLSTKINAATLRTLALPIWNNEWALHDELRMTGPNVDFDCGLSAGGQTQVNIVNAPHALAGGLAAGLQAVHSGGAFVWGTPESNAQIVAELAGSPGRAVIFAFGAGWAMSGGFVAPAKRLGYFYDNNTAAGLNASGLALFDAAVQWIACASLPTPTPTVPPTPIPAATPQSDPFDNASLAAFWTVRDIGNPAAGFQSEGGSLSFTAGGCDIWSYADQFRFLSQPCLGDFDATLRINFVPNTDAWSKTGLMLRAGEGKGDAYVLMAASFGNNYTLQYRPGLAQDAVNAFQGGAYSSGSPGWVRLKREGI